MPVLVADTSGLVSLGTAAAEGPDPLALLVDTYDIHLPEQVVAELREVAEYDDPHGRAADAVLGRLDEMRVEPVTLDEAFPLDDGENAAVTLANDLDAELLLCDEFTRIGLIHASLAAARLVTTPTLLAALVRNDRLTPDEAVAALDRVAAVRSWDGNAYVERARAMLTDGES
jgi:predicted nucleic acid-binding protein